MSSLWTPEGEHPVGSSRRATPPPSAPPPGRPDDGPGGSSDDEPDVEALRQQLAQTPVDVVVANHAFGLFELAALHLSLRPPQLDEARLAIDAVASLVQGLTGRLGEAEPTLNEGLAQLRLAFVQIKAATEAAGAGSGPTEGADSGSTDGQADDTGT